MRFDSVPPAEKAKMAAVMADCFESNPTIPNFGNYRTPDDVRREAAEEFLHRKEPIARCTSAGNTFYIVGDNIPFSFIDWLPKCGDKTKLEGIYVIKVPPAETMAKLLAA